MGYPLELVRYPVKLVEYPLKLVEYPLKLVGYLLQLVGYPLKQMWFFRDQVCASTKVIDGAMLDKNFRASASHI